MKKFKILGLFFCVLVVVIYVIKVIFAIVGFLFNITLWLIIGLIAAGITWYIWRRF